MTRFSIKYFFWLSVLIILISGCTFEKRTSPFPINPSPTSFTTPTPLPTRKPYQLKPGELELGGDSFFFPIISVNETFFISGVDAQNEIQDDDLIIGVSLNQDNRAYPVKLLSLYEIINDTVGRKPVAVTWCPLCYSAVVYSRELNQELTFGVSGYLLNNNLVMVDVQSNTLWNQVLGEAIRGGYKGQNLERIPFIMTNWGTWENLHPNSLLLSASKLGNDPSTLVDPYELYYQMEWAGFGSKEDDTRLPPKELVLGINIAEDSRAYTIEQIIELGIIQDELAGVQYVIIFDKETQSVFLYHSLVKEQFLTFSYDPDTRYFRDDQTLSLWDIQTGTAISGSLKGGSLETLEGLLIYWFAWSDFYPGTEIYNP